MAMSPSERDAYLSQITPEIEAAADKVFQEQFGRSFSDSDMKRAPVTHAEKNGDSSQHPADSWQQIRRDFPRVFGWDA